MLMNLEMMIDGVFAHLRELERPIAQKRRHGVDTAMVTAKLRSLGLHAPADLVQLYSLCDGTETVEGEVLDDIHLIPGYYWIKLDESVVIYRSLIRDQRWSTNWFPIFSNGGGDFYAVICNENSSDFGGIVGFIVGESDHLVEFANVTTLFKTIDRSFSENAFFVTDGYLEADYPKMRAIARAAQPGFAEHDAFAAPAAT